MSRVYGTGERVEVKGFNCWLPATVFSSNEESDKNLMIQYLKIGDCAVDSVSVANVRPAPPQPKRAKFQIGSFIEVFQLSKGWRSGKLVGFCEGLRCAVVFRGQEKATSVPFRDVRPCLHWIKGSWISHSVQSVILQIQPTIATTKLQKRKNVDPAETEPLKKKMKAVSSLIPKKSHNGIPLQKIACSKFKVGSEVEVRSDEDGYEGARFNATAVASLGQKLQKRKYAV